VMSYPLDRHLVVLGETFTRVGWELRKELVWVKDAYSFWAGAQYQQQHEPVLVCARRGASVRAAVPVNQSTVFHVARPRAHDAHPTAKPLALWLPLLCYHVPRGAGVFDPFLGSGTTLIAAELQGRRCVAVEREPRYVDVAVARWERLSGQTATLETTRKGKRRGAK